MQFLTLSPHAFYYGFDLFEDFTPELDAEEMNVKKHHSVEEVSKLLAGHKFKLFKGNTRETLKDFNEPVDFVWLDGGHSVETVQSDWDNIKRCLLPDAVVLFDDYYTGGIDTEKYGCNKVVASLNYEVLPAVDRVRDGGYVQVVRVYPEA